MIKTNCWYCSKEYEMGAVIHTCTEPFINKNHKYGHCPCDGCKDYTERKDVFISKWIPCSERLPRPYTEVLVCDECGWISLGSYRPCDVTEKDSGWSTLTRIKITTVGIIAWMPLPTPWKGADDET